MLSRVPHSISGARAGSQPGPGDAHTSPEPHGRDLLRFHQLVNHSPTDVKKLGALVYGRKSGKLRILPVRSEWRSAALRCCRRIHSIATTYIVMSYRDGSQNLLACQYDLCYFCRSECVAKSKPGPAW